MGPLIAILAATTAQAMEIRTGEHVDIGPTEVVNDDLYVFARDARVDGLVLGDLVVFGETVSVGGRVQGDVLGAGRSLVLAGNTEDVRVAGADVRVAPASRIRGDLLVGAGRLETQAGSAVTGDVALGAGKAELAGGVGGAIDGTAGLVRLNGPVAGDVQLTVSGPEPNAWWRRQPAASGLVIGPRASIGGTLSYTAPAELVRERGALPAGVEQFTPTPAPERASYALEYLRRYLGLLLIGGLFALAAPRMMARAADRVGHRGWTSLGIGLIGGVSWAVAAVIVGVLMLFGVGTLAVGGFGGLAALWLGIGAMLQLAGWLLFDLVGGFLAQAVVGLALGQRFVTARRWFALVTGLAAFVVVATIPVIGAVVEAIAGLLGLGAVIGAVLRPSDGAAAPEGAVPA